MKSSKASHFAFSFVLFVTCTGSLASTGAIAFAGVVTESTCAVHIHPAEVANQDGSGNTLGIGFSMSACSSIAKETFRHQIRHGAPVQDRDRTNASSASRWLQYVVTYD